MDADPGTSSRALEALRMTVGLTLGANRVEVILTGKGERLLEPEQHAFEDYRRAREYLQVLDDAGVRIRTGVEPLEATEAAEVVVRWTA